MVAGHVLLSDEDRALLLRVSNLLEELLETLDVLEDKEALKAIKEAEEDVKAGKVRDYDEFIGGAEKSWRNIGLKLPIVLEETSENSNLQ